MSAHPTQPPRAAPVSPYFLTPEAREVIRRRSQDIRAALHWRRAQRHAAAQLADMQRTAAQAANAPTAYIPYHWPQVKPYPRPDAPRAVVR